MSRQRRSQQNQHSSESEMDKPRWAERLVGNRSTWTEQSFAEDRPPTGFVLRTPQESRADRRTDDRLEPGTRSRSRRTNSEQRPPCHHDRRKDPKECRQWRLHSNIRDHL